MPRMNHPDSKGRNFEGIRHVAPCLEDYARIAELASGSLPKKEVNTSQT